MKIDHAQISQALHAFVNEMTVIDAHSHLTCRDHEYHGEDIFAEYLSGNMNSDLISAGMPMPDLVWVRNHGGNLAMKWERLEPYWNACRHTGYARVLDHSVRLLYGIDRIDGDSLADLCAAYQAMRQGDRYTKILRESCHVECCIVDSNMIGNPLPIFRQVFRLDRFFSIRTVACLEALEKELCVTICSLDDLVQLCETHARNAMVAGAVGLKMSLSYLRTLDFEPSQARMAEEIFCALRNGQALHNAALLQNFLVHRALLIIQSYGGIVQIHTGMHEGHGNILKDSHPLALEPLLRRYPEIHFDLLHCGFPYTLAIALLVKNNPNAWLNMCWYHSIAPTHCQRTLAAWLDFIPVEKIIGLGADNSFPDCFPGNHFISKQNLIAALANKVAQAGWSLCQAEHALSKMLYNNAKTMYQL